MKKGPRHEYFIEIAREKNQVTILQGSKFTLLIFCTSTLKLIG